MFPWQDDHTLFFKLANIEGKAGYFGFGPFGQGAYKYIVTPYILIYKLFGLNPTPYFAFAIILYFISAIVVYKVFSEIIGSKGGKVAGFLYAAGYVASDGYIRVFNSVSTSVGIILVSLLVFSYWKFFKKKKNVWYLLSVIFYFLALEFGRIRTHYLISIPFIFEFTFLALKKSFRSVFISVVRLIPFVYIFYKYFLESADSRSSQVGMFFQSLQKGEFYKTYSFFSGITNIIFSENLITFITSSIKPSLLYIFTGAVFTCVAFVLLRNIRRRVLFTIIFVAISIVWGTTSNGIFTSTALSLGSKEFFVVYLAGEIIFLSFVVFVVLEKTAKMLFLFLVLWLSANLTSYSIYNPSLSFVQYHRYLAHSFLALVGILGLLSQRSKLMMGAVLVWGLFNLGNAGFYQQAILKVRSEPVISFYSQLRKNVPNVQKGDIFYFDVADNAREYFEDAFSVASMPEETALAWQYGIDRYDIRRLTRFEDFSKHIKTGTFTDIDNKTLKIENIYSFFYSKEGLVNTTSELRAILKGPNVTNEVSGQIEVVGKDFIITLSKPFTSLTPTNMSFSVAANPPMLDEIKYPYISNQKLINNKVSKNLLQRKLAFEYQRQKNLLSNNAKVSVSSSWKEDLATNLVDGRSDTSWRADRVMWSKVGANVVIDYGKEMSVSRLVWLNGNATNTPTKYEIEVSLDGDNWKIVANVSSRQKVESGILQVIDFSPEKIRFVRMNLKETLSSDSASLAEMWVVPTAFSDLDINETEEFLRSPFGFVPDRQSFQSTLTGINRIGKVDISWLSDKSATWQTTSLSVINIHYDGFLRTYNLVIPASGTKIKKLKFTQEQIPGSLNFGKRIFVRNLNLEQSIYETK